MTGYELMLEAARQLRRDAEVTAAGDANLEATLLAAADWLDVAVEWSARDEPEFAAALALARAFTGIQEGTDA